MLTSFHFLFQKDLEDVIETDAKKEETTSVPARQTHLLNIGAKLMQRKTLLQCLVPRGPERLKSVMLLGEFLHNHNQELWNCLQRRSERVLDQACRADV